MGKYSLDAFEVHPLVKLRPSMTEPAADSYQLLELSQLELEPKSGSLRMPPPVDTGRVILRLKLDGNEDLADACGFIRRMGYCYDGGKLLEGVVMTEGPFSCAEGNQLVQAYRQAFEDTYLLAEPGAELAEIANRVGAKFGLWLSLNRGILPLRRSIGCGNLARNWENCPVYIWSGREMTAEELDAARRWHASGADVPAILGPRMTLRRMMFPEHLTAGGPLPLRIWWQNLGTAPCYRDVEICLELRRNGERHRVMLSEKTVRPGMGDTTFNTIGSLPQENGTFELWCGLCSRDAWLPLAMDAYCEAGMYRIGQITLDDIPRPYLSTMWEETYADGYYPLEDPAQPE